MEKINFKNLPDKSTPINSANLNLLQDNVEASIEELSNKNNYSTEERVIGEWIDGKPIYRKVIEGITDESGGMQLGIITNIDNLINIYGYIQSATGHQFSPNSSMGIDGSNDIRIIKIPAGNIQIQFGSYFYNCSYEFSLEYTKTTD